MRLRSFAAFGVLLTVACAGDTSVDDKTSITGHIFDAETMVDLTEARITAMPRLTTAQTDEAGMFELEGARYATLYQLRIEHEGYESRTVNITPAVNEDNHVELGLDILEVCTPDARRCVGGGGVAGFETCAARGNAWTLTECPAAQVCDTVAVECRPAHTLTVRQPIGGSVVSQPSGIVCGTSCMSSFVSGTEVRLVANADTMGTFIGWTDDCAAAGTDPVCTLTMDQPHTVGATFESFSLAVQRQGDGDGRVVSMPAGIDCGRTCAASFDEDEVVTLMATPVAPSVFLRWGGDCTGSAGCQVTIDGPKVVRALFEIPKFTLDVTRAGTGAGSITSAPMGIDCGSECSFDYDIDTMVTLTATAAAGSTFEGWTGDCTGLALDCVVTMDAARSVTATFDGIAYPLTVTLPGNGSGTVTSVPSGIDCGTTCVASYGPATMVTLTAAPDAGSTFTTWGDACAAAGANPTCDVTMNAAVDASATFTIDAVAFTVTLTGDGRVTSVPAGIDCPGDCTEAWMPGTMVTLTAAPNAGSGLGTWGGDCAAAANAATCDVTVAMGSVASAAFEPLYSLPLPADGTCQALFHLDAAPYTSSCGGGPLTPSGTYNLAASRNVYLSNALVAAGADEEGYLETAFIGAAPPASTIELTVRKDGLAYNARGAAVLYSDLDSTDPTRTGFRLSVHDDGRLVAETRAGPGQVTTASTAVGAIADGTWYHVAATISDTTGLAIFVDGAEAIRVAGTPLWTASSSTAWVGAEREGAGAIFRLNGAVDEVRVSNVVRY